MITIKTLTRAISTAKAALISEIKNDMTPDQWLVTCTGNGQLHVCNSLEEVLTYTSALTCAFDVHRVHNASNQLLKLYERKQKFMESHFGTQDTQKV